MRISSMLAGALLLALPVTSRAETVWDMATEYPQNTMPGLGVTTFAKRLEELSSGNIRIKPGFDAAAGIKSAGMLAAVADNRVQAGDAFAGALENEDPIFALPSLPFLATSIADARRLADLARPVIAAALQQKGQRLLYLTPWPPSGIWSKGPLKTPADLASLSIRTYDKVSSDVFAAAGAKAASISFADTMPKLVDGSMNAVLSSGDGGAGKRMAEFLHQFTEITYSLPLSVASLNQSAYDGLTPELKAAVDAAGRQTETELWTALSIRLQANYKRMAEDGVTIDSSPAPDVVAALRSGSVSAQRAWCSRAGAVCNQILDAFNAGKK
ncbi:TRAP transporter substrate-binding protein [Rhodopseudomonas sp. RCAM05734]|uniref:TRAP transporter substrate-binding protein n=1 Tax=Rhodopseudomonas sp. RCAM05734 TaxID=3457549 RepID=UPI004044E9F3